MRSSTCGLLSMPAGEALAVCGLPLSWPLPRVNTAVQLAPPSVETSAWQNSPFSNATADVLTATDTALYPAVETDRVALAVPSRRSLPWWRSTLRLIAPPAMTPAPSVGITCHAPALDQITRDT